ncbi:endonuclease/exonuclease/phosphatase family protein [Vibrio sp. WXL103]|uniref:endonuclease/exonuclease/phosphatase family protein n=1 Tax=Vibrio sp. WXL103 TaxID=3450710 RepID=UPI003EC61EAD
MKKWLLTGLTLLISLLTSAQTYATDGYFPLKIVSWNIEWLSSEQDHSVPQARRTSDDFAALRRYFEIMSPDVLAFQEINDLKAIQKIVGSNYAIVLSDRANAGNRNHQFKDLNQYTGFAIKKRLAFENVTDVRLSNRRNSKLRFGAYIVLAPDSEQPLHLLSVHLKAGCSGAFRDNSNCQQLKQQGQVLADWIAEREKAGQHYVIAGDFNHNLAYPNDWLWQTLTQSGQLELATAKTSAKCKVRSNRDPNRLHQFRSLIDHIIVSAPLSASKVRQNIYSSRDVLDYHLSDHCPVIANIDG